MKKLRNLLLLVGFFASLYYLGVFLFSADPEIERPSATEVVYIATVTPPFRQPMEVCVGIPDGLLSVRIGAALWFSYAGSLEEGTRVVVIDYKDAWAKLEHLDGMETDLLDYYDPWVYADYLCEVN